MPEPVTSSATAAATLAGATAALPALTAFGVNLGLQPAVLVAGFAGALVAIVLLNTVPTTGDTWQHLLRTTLRRLGVAVTSSLAAGYLTPLVSLAFAASEPLLLSAAFVTGAGAQRLLRSAVDRANRTVEGSKA